MYILQKCYKEAPFTSFSTRLLVVVMPSTKEKSITRFKEIVEEAINEINKDYPESKWDTYFLCNEDKERSAQHNFSKIFDADVVVAECTDLKANVFYLIGLAHAMGRPVCSCYRNTKEHKAEIPFNVKGRQCLSYTISTMEQQDLFRKKIKEWIKRNE